MWNMRSISELAKSIRTFIHAICLILTLTYTFLLAFGVASRYLFKVSIFADEISVYLFVAVVFLGLDFVWERKAHIRVDLFLDLIPGRVRAYVEDVQLLMLLLYSGLLLVGTIDFVATLFMNKVRAFTYLETPLFLPAILMPIGVTVFMIRLTIEICKRFFGKHQQNRS